MQTNAVLYCGAPTKGNQSVSEEVRSRGINLLRSTPTASYPEVISDVYHFQYLNYRNHFAAACKAAITDKYVYLNDASKFFYLPTTTLPTFHRLGNIIWNFDRGVASETLSSIRERYNAVETMAQGKPAFCATLTYTQLTSLCKEYKPNDKTPASTTTMNISGARGYKQLSQIADLFLRVHQYPLMPTDKTKSSYFKDALQVTMKDVEADTKVEPYPDPGPWY